MAKKMEAQSMSDAVGEHLRQYAIGAKIRALRLAKGIGLVQLGRHSGLSAGLLSKIERGLLVPPLPTLVRIAMVFGVGLDHFFSEQAGPLAFVTRKQDRLRLPDDPGREPPAYFFESLDYPATDRPMDVLYSRVPRGIGSARSSWAGTRLRDAGPAHSSAGQMPISSSTQATTIF